MRLISLIFGFYVFLLVAAPCGDHQDCDENAAITATADHDEHGHESENCSPFCICSCCGTYSQVELVYHFIPVPAVHNALIIPSHTDPVSEISIAIWQPPQLG